MRGLSAFVLTVLLPSLFATLVGFAVLASLRKSWRDRYPFPDQPRALGIGKGLLTSFAVFIWAMLMFWVSYAHLRIHYDLWTLQPEDVQEIQVGSRQFRDHDSINRIVKALKSSQWYSVNHGGWGDETALIFEFRSGAAWQMRAGYHFAQHGAVVLRSTGPQGSGWALGEVFSTALPDTLAQLGVPLSFCDTPHGHPCSPASTVTMH